MFRRALADVVRRWVGALEGRSDDVAFGLLGPQTQAAIGGREGYPRARRDLDRQWATTPSATFDALPAVRVGDDWRVEPLLDTAPTRVRGRSGTRRDRRGTWSRCRTRPG